MWDSHSVFDSGILCSLSHRIGFTQIFFLCTDLLPFADFAGLLNAAISKDQVRNALGSRHQRIYGEGSCLDTKQVIGDTLTTAEIRCAR